MAMTPVTPETKKLEPYEMSPLELLRQWLDESYRTIAPQKLVARLGSPGLEPEPSRPTSPSSRR